MSQPGEKSKSQEKQVRKISNPSTSTNTRLDTVKLPVSVDLTNSIPPNTTRINSIKTSSLTAEMNSTFNLPAFTSPINYPGTTGFSFPYAMPDNINAQNIKKVTGKFKPTLPTIRKKGEEKAEYNEDQFFLKDLETSEQKGLPDNIPLTISKNRSENRLRYPITGNFPESDLNPLSKPTKQSHTIDDKKDTIKKDAKFDINTMDFEKGDLDGITYPMVLPLSKKKSKKIISHDSKDTAMNDLSMLSDATNFPEGSEVREILYTEDGFLEENEKQLFFIQLPSQLPLKLPDKPIVRQRKPSDENASTTTSSTGSGVTAEGTSQSTPVAGTSTPKVEPKKKPEQTVGNTDTPADNINAVDFVSNLPMVPGGYLGEMLIYKSGKMKLKLGDVLLDVQPGVQSECTQHAIAISEQTQKCSILGPVVKRIVCIPDVEYFLDTPDKKDKPPSTKKAEKKQKEESIPTNIKDEMDIAK